MLVYLQVSEVVDGEVPQHVCCDRGMPGIQNHTPDDEKSVLVVNMSAPDEGRHALSVVGSDVPREKWVIVTRSMIVIPLHDASPIQNGLCSRRCQLDRIGGG